MIKRHSDQKALISQLIEQSSKRIDLREAGVDTERPLIFKSTRLSEDEKVKISLSNGYLESLKNDRDFIREARIVSEFDATGYGFVQFRMGKLKYVSSDTLVSLPHYGNADLYPIYDVAGNFDDTLEKDRLHTLVRIGKAIEDEVEKSGLLRALIEGIHDKMEELFGEDYASKSGVKIPTPAELNEGWKFSITSPLDPDTYSRRAPALANALGDMILRMAGHLSEGKNKVDVMLPK